MHITFTVFGDEPNISCASSSAALKPSMPIQIPTLPTKISTSQYEAPLTGKPLTIRGKAVRSLLQHKEPMSDVPKKEKNADIIKSCIQQLSQSAADVASKITRPETVANTEELNFLQYLVKHACQKIKNYYVFQTFYVSRKYIEKVQLLILPKRHRIDTYCPLFYFNIFIQCV